MPNLPVPHIVGDDESDTDDPLSPDQQMETDSCHSSSSHEEDDDDSSSSSDGADWSMNVTRIAGTPGRVPVYAATPLIKSAVVVERRLRSPILAFEDNAPPIREMDVDMEEKSLLSCLSLQPSQVTTNGVDDLKEPVPTSTSSKNVLSPKPSTSRNSGKPSTAAPNQTVRSLRSASGTMSGRGAGRVGRSLRIRNIGIPNTAAKPLDVTSYFRLVSANLVRNRISVNSFEIIRDNVNRLLFETSKDDSLIPPSKRYSC